MKRILFPILFILTLVSISCDILPGVSAPTPVERQFTVEAGQKYTVAVTLRGGRSLEGDFSISGAQNYIDFYIRGPNGELSYGVVRAVGGQGFQMTVEADGTYTMYFDNSISFGSPRQIFLRYSISKGAR